MSNVGYHIEGAFLATLKDSANSVDIGAAHRPPRKISENTHTM